MKYVAPAIYIIHTAIGQHLLLSSGVEIGIPHGAKATSILDEIDDDE